MTTITLKDPIILRAKDTGAELLRIAEVTFKKPRAGALIDAMDVAAAKGNGSMVAALAAACTGLTLDQVRDLDPEDFMALAEVASGFLPNGPKTGLTPSGSSPAPSGSPAIGSNGAPPNSAS